MQAREVQLASLFITLFEAGELLRFARHTFGEHVALDIDRKASLTDQARQLAEQLQSYDLIGERLFEALLKNRPDHAEFIRQVRRELLDRGDEKDRPKLRPASVLGAPGDQAAGESRRAWRQRMASVLATVAVGRPEPSAPWLEAAAVLPSFDPLTIRPLGGHEKPPRDLLERFAAVCETTVDGRLCLELPRRQKILARLWQEDRLEAALDANPAEVSVHARLLRRVAEQGWIAAPELETLAWLQAAHEIGEWLARSDLSPFNRDQIASVLERHRRVEPLRRLLGRHFRGRKPELERLRDHLEADGSQERILVLWGVGGVGKSTLLGKLLLDLEQSGDAWVYLDFDDPEVDPLDPLGIVELVARQLAQFFASASPTDTFYGLESLAAGDEPLAFTYEVAADAGIEQLLAAIEGGLRALPSKPALRVVFDTFEQVQVRGRHAVERVRGLLDALCAAVPYVRIVISGRAAVVPWADAEELQLEDLDDRSADQVLAALGIDDAKLRRKVRSRVGTSPLSLRLAADALKSDRLDEEDLESMVLQARRIEMQGQLYTRILGHIQDGEVRRLAHPGLIVRRVTPGVIREVLAELCDIDAQQAAAIFARLPDQVSLFEPDQATAEEGAALRHRQDVREIMLRLMVEDPVWKDRLHEIHSRTIAHYARRKDPIGRAEEIYHRLMRDDDPEISDSRWTPDLAVSLGRCWDEPLPERARAWLGPRIGRTHGDLAAWRTEDWEISAQREAQTRLGTGDAAGALAVLRKRGERTPGSRLYGLEVRALMQLERWPQAAALVARVLGSNLEAFPLDEILELHLLGAETELHRERFDDLQDYVAHALKIATETGDSAGQLRAYELRVHAARRGGSPAAADLAVEQLQQALLVIDDSRLRRHVDLSRRVLELLRPHSTPVLRKVASAFGNRAEQKVIRRDAFKLGDLLEQVVGTADGKAQLSRLAGKVGLSEESFQLRDLANHTIRYDKLGDALVTVLDYAGDNESVRRGAEAMVRGLSAKGGIG